MINRAILLSFLAIIFLFIGCAEHDHGHGHNGDDSHDAPTADAPSYPGPEYRSVHLYNMPDGVSDEDMQAVLDDFNALVAEMGYPMVKFRMWLVRGEMAGEYEYMGESTWPNQGIYDEVTSNEKYTALMGTHEAFFKGFEDAINNKYIDLSGGDDKGSGTHRGD